MSFKLRTLLIILAAFATLAPVCVLAGGDSETTTDSVTLAEDALVEIIGENAEIRVHRSTTSTLDLEITMNNKEFVDFYTQSLSGDPVSHFVISATTSTGGEGTANSTIDVGVPSGVQLAIRTTNRPITIDSAALTSGSLETTNAQISVTDSAGDFDLNTTNSEVVVQGTNGHINVITTNTHVWFDGAVTSGTNSLATTNGDIAVRISDASSVLVTGTTHNGDVTVNGGVTGVIKDGVTASVSYPIGGESATLNLMTGPGAIHINPEIIAVFDEVD